MYRYKLNHIRSSQVNFIEPFPYLHKVEYQIPLISSLQNIFSVCQRYVIHIIFLCPLLQFFSLTSSQKPLSMVFCYCCYNHSLQQRAPIKAGSLRCQVAKVCLIPYRSGKNSSFSTCLTLLFGHQKKKKGVHTVLHENSCFIFFIQTS